MIWCPCGDGSEEEFDESSQEQDGEQEQQQVDQEQEEQVEFKNLDDFQADEEKEEEEAALTVEQWMTWRRSSDGNHQMIVQLRSCLMCTLTSRQEN